MLVPPIAAFVAGETFWGTTALLTGLSTWAYAVAILAGSAYFYQLYTVGSHVSKIRGKPVEKPIRTFFALVVLFPILLAPYALRLVVEITCFAGVNAPPTIQPLLIVGASGARTWGTWLNVSSANPNSRDPRVKVASNLHSAYQHISTHGKDCLLLPVQTGRWGFARVIRPTFWSDPIENDRVQTNCLPFVMPTA